MLSIFRQSSQTSKQGKQKPQVSITPSENTDKYLNERMRLSYYKTAVVEQDYIK